MKNTVDDFMDAFWTLYQNKAIEKISVRELCELAGYNRTTFYVYFKDIYDLLEQFIKVRVLPEPSMIKVSELLFDSSLIQNIMCHFFQKNNRYVEEILKHHHNYMLQEAMISRIKMVLGSSMPEEFEYVVRYQISAILGVLEFWYQQGANQITEEQLLTLIYGITTKGVLASLIQTME